MVLYLYLQSLLFYTGQQGVIQEVNNKGLTIVGITTAVHKTKSVWKQRSVLDNKDNKNIKNNERVSTMK